MTTIGICEDDAALRGSLRTALQRAGHDVLPAASGAEALQRFGDGAADVLVLDIGLPDADGRDVCQALRARGVRSPVLFLTARSTLPDRLSGFHAGGDDYLVKPFAVGELLVRVDALLRRPVPAGTGVDDDPTSPILDPTSHAIAYDGLVVPLTPTEFRMLAALLARRGTVVRRAALVSAAWPDGAIVHDNTIDTYIARLRRKLGEAGAPVAIATRRGVGYIAQ